jgi:hypothetical protein
MKELPIGYQVNTEEQLDELRKLHPDFPFIKDNESVRGGRNVYPCIIYSECRHGATWCSNMTVAKGITHGYISSGFVYSEWSSKVKIDTIEEQIKYAKTWIGKKVQSARDPNRYGIVESYSVKTTIDGLNNESGCYSKIIDLQGAVVVLEGKWNAGDGMSKIVHPLYPIVEYTKPIVKINGYHAIDKGDYFEFGCAKISKTMLKRAYDFLKDTNNWADCGNRKTVSVKIGAGDFTLEDLKNLLNY